MSWWEVDGNYDYLVDGLRAETKPVGDDGLGEVNAGYMELRALCLEVDATELCDGSY